MKVSGKVSIWLLALIVYAALFILSILVAFLIDTLRVIAKRIVTKRKG